MGLFGKKGEGGLMDIIRCDELDYLIWKWSPNSDPEARRSNSIRYGSSLRVKDGEVAVFVYKQSDGTMQDFIEGPFDKKIETANFPVLSSIVGAAFGGNSPFQAEVYFINLQGTFPMPVVVPQVNITDPRYEDYTAPAKVRGKMIFNITDYKRFIKLNKLNNFDIDDMTGLMREGLWGQISSVVAKAPKNFNFSIFRIDSYKADISRELQPVLQDALSTTYGINVVEFAISEVVFDTQSDDYKRLDKIIKGRTETIADAQAKATTLDIEDQRQLNLDLRARMNEEAQRAQKLQTESSFITAHQINVQGDVARTAAESLGQLGGGMSFGDGGGMNPAGMMTGMMMGTAVGGGMSNMMGNMMQGLNQPQPPQPPTGAIAQYHISNNGQQAGPYSMAQLQQLAAQGQITPATHVWKPGMAQWCTISQLPELGQLFAAVPPPPPSGPPAPPVPPGV